MTDEFENMVSELTNAVLGDSSEGEAQAAKPTAPPLTEGGESDESEELDFGEMPNGVIRYTKLKKQKADLEAKFADLQTQFAEIKGKVSVLEKPTSEEQEADPTEYFDEQGKFLFDQNRQLIDAVKILANELGSLKKEKTLDKFGQQEKLFLEEAAATKEQREEIVEQVREYIQAKPKVKALLRDGDLTFEEIYGAVQAKLAKAEPKKRTQDPEAVFSGTPKSPSSSRVRPNSDIWKNSNEIMSDRSSSNKGDAVNATLDALADDIMKLF